MAYILVEPSSFSAIVTNNLLQVTKQIGSLLSKSFQKTGQIEGLQISMETLLVSAEEAKTRFKELADFTKGTSFEVGRLYKQVMNYNH